MGQETSEEANKNNLLANQVVDSHRKLNYSRARSQKKERKHRTYLEQEQFMEKQSHAQFQQITHEGILKLSSLPFPNSIQLSQIDEEKEGGRGIIGSVLFLQCLPHSLWELLEPRLNSNQLFPLKDVLALLESLVYTLAFYESKGIVYPDIRPDLVAYGDGKFKVIPAQLIQGSTYDRVLQWWELRNNEEEEEESNVDDQNQNQNEVRRNQRNGKNFKTFSRHLIKSGTKLRQFQFSHEKKYSINQQKSNFNQNKNKKSLQFDQLKSPPCCSPELIIALRCGQNSIVDKDILWKSIVFELGMLMLEVCTLQPSSSCYDYETYDILDTTISERLVMVQQFYSERLARIIGNMLDYDYVERMGMKDMAVWVSREIREFNALSLPNTNQQESDPAVLSLSTVTGKSRLIASNVNGVAPLQVSSSSSSISVSKSKSTKSNLVYMNQNGKENMESGYNPLGKDDRNKIYLEGKGVSTKIQNQKISQPPPTLSKTPPKEQGNNFVKHGLERVHYLNQELLHYGETSKPNSYAESSHQYYRDSALNYKDTFKLKPVDQTQRIGGQYSQASHHNKVNPSSTSTSTPTAYPKNNTAYTKLSQNNIYNDASKKLVNSTAHYPSLENLFKNKDHEVITSHPYSNVSSASGNSQENQTTAKFRKSTYPYQREQRARGDPRDRGGVHPKEPKEQTQTRQDPKRYNPHFSDESPNNSSISRIKQQILKSRKLIQQFKKSQGLKY